MVESTKHCHVAAIPHPGRGHINPLLSLCKTMAQKNPNNLQITFIVTEEWLGLLCGSSSYESPPTPANMRFATIPNVLPAEKGRGADMMGFMKAVMTKMAQPVEEVLDGFEPPVQLIIADTLLFWVVEMGNRRNIPVASFWSMSASMFSLLYQLDFLLERSLNIPAEPPGEHRIDYIPGISPICIGDLPYGLSQEYKSKLSELQLLQGLSVIEKAHYLLFRTIPELEEHAISALKSKLPVPIYTVGPCIPLSSLDSTNDQPSYMAWLDSQPQNSVLYVSLGSVMPVSGHEVNELAAGLRDSGVPFLWVSREETVKLDGGPGDNGMVVPWCDQMRVLAHGSVGGFLTHCGWNSVLEGVFMGVPMITFPLVFDQKANSKLIVEDWGVGWQGKSNNGVRNSLINKETIAGVVKRLMDLETNARKDLERKCKEVRETARTAIAGGGSAEASLDEFLTCISKK